MPRLSTRSLGLNKGKVCYWAEDDAIARAALVYDLLDAGIERYEVYWLLWLCGFDISLPQLRRAWLHKVRARSERRSAMPPEVTHPVAASDVLKNVGAVSTRSLLDVVLSVNVALDRSREPEIEALIAAFDSPSVALRAMLGRDRDAIIALVKTMWSGLKTGDMIVDSTADELHEARMHASTALRFAHDNARKSTCRTMQWRDWPIDEARAFGAPLFFLTLALLKSGQRALIEQGMQSASAERGQRRRRAAS